MSSEGDMQGSTPAPPNSPDERARSRSRSSASLNPRSTSSSSSHSNTSSTFSFGSGSCSSGSINSRTFQCARSFRKSPSESIFHQVFGSSSSESSSPNLATRFSPPLPSVAQAGRPQRGAGSVSLSPVASTSRATRGSSPPSPWASMSPASSSSSASTPSPSPSPPASPRRRQRARPRRLALPVRIHLQMPGSPPSPDPGPFPLLTQRRPGGTPLREIQPLAGPAGETVSRPSPPPPPPPAERGLEGGRRWWEVPRRRRARSPGGGAPHEHQPRRRRRRHRSESPVPEWLRGVARPRSPSSPFEGRGWGDPAGTDGRRAAHTGRRRAPGTPRNAAGERQRHGMRF